MQEISNIILLTSFYLCRSVFSLRKLRTKWGLKGVRVQKHTAESIAQHVMEIRERLPTAGARYMVAILRRDYDVRVPEYVFNHCCLRLSLMSTFYNNLYY